MQEVTIEGGCTYIDNGYWRYWWSDSQGSHSVAFFCDEMIPTIGDKIINYQLVPINGYKINSDTSKWRQYYESEWPKDDY